MKFKNIDKSQLILYIFVSIFVIKGIFYATMLTPLTIGATPDDMGHFSYIQYLSKEHKIPISGKSYLEEDTLKTSYNSYEPGKNIVDYEIESENFNYENASLNWIAQHPPLYYSIMAVVYKFCKIFTNQFSVILLILRLSTLIFGVLSLLFIGKLLNILNANNIVKYCVYATFVFSTPIQYYLSSVTNDSLLIFLCIFSLYYLLKYLDCKKNMYFYIFVTGCAMIINTKITGGLVIIGYALFFLYESIKEDGLIKTLQLSILGGILGSVLIAPILIINYIHLGRPFPSDGTGDANFNYSFSFFILRSGYLHDIIRRMIVRIGHKSELNPTVNNQILVSIYTFFLSCLYISDDSNKFKNFLLLLTNIAICLIGVYFINMPFAISLVMSSVLILIIKLATTYKDLSLKEKEEQYFFILTLIIVFLIFMKQHYSMYNTYGMLRATHGRYYYIAWFPFVYLLYFRLQKIKDTKLQKIVKWMPVITTIFMITTELSMIVLMIERW